MNLDLGTTVYLDTSAWNTFCDWTSRRSLKWFSGPEYLFSSCNLDEFSLAPPARSKELASLAWRMSNRKKLLDHIELTATEVAAHRGGRAADYFDGRDKGFPVAWAAMRRTGGDTPMREAMRASMESGKQEYRVHLQLMRDTLGPFFRAAAVHGVSREWPDLLDEMSSEPEIREMLVGVLGEPGLGSQTANIAALSHIDYRVLPGTACWVQYHLALTFLAAQKTGRLARPDKGDQVDFRHACYSGIAEVFVTGDKRMHEVLSTMVPACRARVLSPDAFLEIAVGEPPTSASTPARRR